MNNLQEIDRRIAGLVHLLGKASPASERARLNQSLRVLRADRARVVLNEVPALPPHPGPLPQGGEGDQVVIRHGGIEWLSSSIRYPHPLSRARDLRKWRRCIGWVTAGSLGGIGVILIGVAVTFAMRPLLVVAAFSFWLAFLTLADTCRFQFMRGWRLEVSRCTASGATREGRPGDKTGASPAFSTRG